MRLPHLIGKSDKSSTPSLERLFVLSYAHSRLEHEHHLTPRDGSAVVLHPVPPADFGRIRRRAEDAVEAMTPDLTIESSDDPYAFPWLILRCGQFDELVAGVHATSAALTAAGWWEKLLCAVFSFEDERKRPTYWTYNYKWGAFYPISPVPGNHHRDTERERLLKAQLRAADTVEPELGAWFPLWGIPI